ncbi:hypothetical protein [uncultured Roseibium sp.]|uniref:hypothetical protein n=1 Tax=uncultured Roseibium sp. TaxID=1936171 RepID=UPI0026278DDE|nr:hypothetical protein [uncultured Roseibium sp.]
MKKSMSAVLAFGALFVSSAAFAQGVDFSTLDANGDGFVTYEEIQAAGATLPEETYKAADGNQDGMLDEAEFSAIPQ